MSKLSSEIITEKKSSFDNMQDKRELWDNLEQLFHGQLNDSLSKDTKSKVFDPRLASLLIERSYRVMSHGNLTLIFTIQIFLICKSVFCLY
jgi:hypothetical protein